ncbi:hypothetical protein HMI55_003871 [Coelomomyces lativittatus]|nr:hypothetical protein HMI55_003871 [Coelomomyces lativittatus]
MCDRDFNKIHWTQEEMAVDVHTLTGLLKLWFRSLPISVIPQSMGKDLLHLMKSTDSSSLVLHLHAILNQLPEVHYATLKYILKHLTNIARHASTNKMNIPNLSIVFGPTLVHSLSHGTQDMMAHCKIVEMLLDHYTLIFEEEEEDSLEKNKGKEKVCKK